MALTLSNLKPNLPKKSPKRRGRGDASGHGSYSGKGQKGQKARSGGKRGLKLLGMRNVWRRIPKFAGFKSRKEKLAVINLKDLEKKYSKGAEIALPNFKVLGQGKITKKLIVKASAFSNRAKTAIEKAKGKALIIENWKLKIEDYG